MTPRLTLERVRELLAGPPPDSGDPADVQLIVDGPRHLARRKMALCVASEALARDVLALHDALARVTRERDEAVAARDALAGAVRAYLESVDAYDEDDYEDTVGAIDRDRERLDALLDSAPADVVRGDVVRAYLAAVDVLATGETLDAVMEREQSARAALDAALAAGGGR